MNLNLKKGDKVKVSGGPYYLTRSGVKIKLGESGLGIFLEFHKDGKGAIVLFNGERTSTYVYVGEEITSSLTGTIMRPHKISKKRI